MRVRLFGQYVHISIAVLAAIEAVIFLGSMLLAFRLRLGQWHPVAKDSAAAALWLCAGVFGVANLVSALAFGLYSSRQRARTAGVFVRLVAAIAAAVVVTAAIFYVVPSLWLGRGVLALASIFSLVGVGITRGSFTRMMDESLFKRRVLVYGVGQRTAAISSLRRRSDRRGFEIVGFVQPDGESVTVAQDRVLDAAPPVLRLRVRCGRRPRALQARVRLFPLRPRHRFRLRPFRLPLPR